CNEAKAFSIVEPFDDTSFHIPVSLYVYQNGHVALKPHFIAITSATEHFRRPAQSDPAIEIQHCRYTGNEELPSSEFFICP
ncbi:hypothetical protein QMO17_34585, partial [Klebsiella pneumoniae]|nr:hypothetical protein [Klebsiella pneumoniae]